MTSDFCVAVHALVFLHHMGCTKSSEEMAANICTHPSRVRRVMARLKQAELVETKEGADGGYVFAGDPTQVNLRQVAQALGVCCIASGWHSGNADMDCLIASGMAAVMDDIFSDLNDRCMERLGDIPLSAITARLFTDGKSPCRKG